MATVRNETQLRSAIQSGFDPEILVANNITVRTFVSVNRSVTIRTVPGNPTATLFWAPASGMTNQYMFHVYSNGNLTSDTLTMDGQGRNCGMVRLSGGTFTMNDGVTMTGIQSNTSNSAVLVGDMTSTVGGTFIMNGGLITGVDAGPHTVVFCAGGTFIMGGDAVIDNNPSTAITAMDNIVDGTRATVRITGNARISNNSAGQAGGGFMLLRCDAVIGENEDDAPLIIDNDSPSHVGGILALEAVNLTIGGKTEISGNSATLTSGAILVQRGSTLRIGGNVKVKDNKSGDNSGGISVTTNCAAVLEGNAEISGNTAGDETVAGGAGVGDGGGVLLQTGASLEIKGNVSLHGNAARNGGGIYLTPPREGSPYGPPVAIIGSEGSSPSLYENTAENLGGGIFIGEQCDVSLTGQASIHDNSALYGKGVYNDGIFKVAESPKILDGLLFECNPEDIYEDSSQAQSTEKVRIESGDPDFPAIECEIMMHDTGNIIFHKTGGSASAGSQARLELLSCDKVPIIDEPLTAYAEMHIESSEYVALPNVPLAIAQGDSDMIPLSENDRAAWRIPQEFNPGYAVMLTPDRGQVIIDAINYRIVYSELHGAANTNPGSYKINGLPIELTPPGERKGYTFIEWQDEAGNPVTGIPEGSIGDLTLIAVWQAQDYNIVYYDLYGATHTNPVSYNIEDLPIRLTAPSARTGYAFVGWQDAAGNPAAEIPEGTTGDLVFTAVWQEQTYNITYQNLHGTMHTNPASYNIVNLPIRLTAPSPRSGYAFIGWQDAAGNPITEIPEGTTGDLALTAVWQAEVYRVAYYNLFGTMHPNPASYSVENLPIRLAAPSQRAGYTFVGWQDASGNLTAEIPVDSIGDLAFTAVWQARVYEIVYENLLGAAHSNPASYTAESLPILLTPPSERAGYIFAGWRDGVGNFVTEIAVGSTGDLVFTAVWEELSLILSFDGNASCVSCVPESIRAQQGAARIPYTVPCRPCHIFVCWNENDSGTGKAYFPGDEVQLSDRSIVLFAQWRFTGCCRGPVCLRPLDARKPL